MELVPLYLHHFPGRGKYIERWVSGLNQQFAKLSYGSNCTGGSNPPLSAEIEKRLKKIKFLLLKIKIKFIPLCSGSENGNKNIVRGVA
jgi:hypothetical protein